MSTRPAAGRRYLATSPFKPPVIEEVDYAVGDWVNTDRYGLGRIISVEDAQSGSPACIVVDHRGGNARRFTLPATSVTKLAD